MVAEGKIIAHHEGRVIFVDGGAPGDLVDVRVLKKKSGYYIAKVTHIHKYSKDRTEPFCSHFGICGGCKWQHLHYKKQLAYKEKIITESFRRTGKIDNLPLDPIIPSGKEVHYRNKLEYTFTNNRWLTKAEISTGEDISGRDGLGFHIPGAFDRVIEVDKCWLQDSRGDEIRNGLADFARANKLAFFDLRKQTGLLRNLIIRNTLLDEWMVIVSFAKNDKIAILSVMSYLKKTFPFLTSLYFVVNPKRNDTIFDLEPKLFDGLPFIREQIGTLTYQIGPKSFFQTNSSQARMMYQLVDEMAGIKKGELVYDLYTGTGSIALMLAVKAGKVIGIEQVEASIKNARLNAKNNGIENVEFHAGLTEKLLSEEFLVEQGKPDVVITDPPRAGMHPSVVASLNDSGASRIVYVSCNPVTMARDIQRLNDHYEIKRIQPLDMFPHTFQIESIGLLEKRTP